MSGPLTEKDIIFPHSSSNVISVARQVHKASTTQSISARLKSIESDVAFVAQQARTLKLPVVANERCGSWYVSPDLKAGSAYFKSTDGHHGQWAFNLRRLNLHLLTMIGTHGGCMLVDSTRRGKHAPDALAKTVPIWCAVFNSLLFPERDDASSVRLHPSLVSKSEHVQIETRMPNFIQEALRLHLDLNSLRNEVKKPLLPQWIVSSLPQHGNLPADDCRMPHNYVYLCMASTYHESYDKTNYIQGAGDDSESWAKGLTPELFWAHRTQLLTTSEVDLHAAIATISQSTISWETQNAFLSNIDSFQRLHVGDFVAGQNIGTSWARIFIIDGDPDAVAGDATEKRLDLYLRCATGKLGSRDLRTQLFELPGFLENIGERIPIAVLCAVVGDLAIGVALAILSLYGNSSGTSALVLILKHTDRSGEILAKPTPIKIDKALIRRRLACIAASMPNANPSRATLNAVNSFLMAKDR